MKYEISTLDVRNCLNKIKISEHPLTRWEKVGLFETKFLQEFFRTFYRTGIDTIAIEKKTTEFTSMYRTENIFYETKVLLQKRKPLSEMHWTRIN